MREGGKITLFRGLATVISLEIVMIGRVQQVKCFFIGNSAITWNIVKQSVFALLSCEAKYIAASAASCQGIWIIRFVEELLNIKVIPFKLFVDNKSAIALSKNPSQHGRSKHIETKFHFIHACMEKGYVDIEYVNTESQLTDSFTKPLGHIKFEEI